MNDSKAVKPEQRKKIGLFFAAVLALMILTTGPAFGQQYEEAKLVDPLGDCYDLFGFCLAVSGNWAVVAALDETVIVFGYCPAWLGWYEHSRLVPSDLSGGQSFGHALAIDGDLILVGSEGDDDNGLASGSAYLFRFDPGTGTWIEEAKLLASDGDQQDRFGISVSLDGDRLLIGACRDDDNGYESGSAYIFRYDAGMAAWSEEAKLVPSDGAAIDYFGMSLSLDGDRALIGSNEDDDVGTDSGSAYLFQFDPGSSTWIEEAKLLASDGSYGDRFGHKTSLDGDRLLISNMREVVYVFERDPVSETWSEVIILTEPSSSGYGDSISIEGDVALIGAWSEYGAYWTGVVYVYHRDPGNGIWEVELELLPSDGDWGSSFGAAVCLSGDVALVGAPNIEQYSSLEGAAYVHRLERDPGVDIACNGQDQGVIVQSSENVVLTIDVESGFDGGVPVDIWVLASAASSGAHFSCGYQGAAAWLPGFSNVYFTGGLADETATVLDQPLPTGMYTAWLVVDDVDNGALELRDIWMSDEVSFFVVP